ncbi:MAG TPA: FAD-dependent oxidoreductase [Jatrophihabitans sp.]|nr:FAD-dependent oxidoreductase [Jatrophihabitans sp.]
MAKADRLVVVGGGLSGLACALGASLHSHPVTVFETADRLGGAAAYSGGQVWVGANHVARRRGVVDSLERTESYVRGIATAYPDLLDEAAMTRWLTTAPDAMRYWEDVGAVAWTVIDGLGDYHQDVAGAAATGRYLTGEPVDPEQLGDYRDRLLTSPYFTAGVTYQDLFAKGRRATADAEPADVLTLGAGLVAGFLARLRRQPDVEVLLNTRVTALIREDDGTVIGVRADGPDGPVERRGPVVLATSSFDWAPDLVREFLGLDPDEFGSLAPPTLRGDAVTLARAAGADVVHMPPTCVPMVPGWLAPGGGGYANGPEYALPHAILVDRSGRRFCNDSYWVDIVAKALADGDRHLPFFLIWDEQHHRSYGLGGTPPGAPYPPGMVATATTVDGLATQLGIDPAGLQETVTSFSANAERGLDPEFGRGTIEFINRFSGDPAHRPSPVLGPIRETPFHGMQMIFVGTGIGCSGVRIDGEGRVLDTAGAPVPGLYAAGSCAATTTFGSGYNSGMALGRGLTLAYLIASAL